MNPDSPLEPDSYQQAWQAQASQTRVTVDADLLRKEVQRNQGDFRTMIFLRDCREVGVSLSMIPLWFFLGAWNASPWTWYLTVPALIWVIGFFLVDRMRHPQTPSAPDDSLLESVKESLTQVEHQIWLLRNVFWWYLLPPGISIMAFFAHVSWMVSNFWLGALVLGGFSFGFLVAVYYFVYWLNQYAVRTQLEPRRQELLALLASLKDETSSEDERGGSAAIQLAASVKTPIGRTVSVMVLLAALTVLGSIAADYFGRAVAGSSPKRSPFAAVRWQQSQPEVKVGDEWFQLVSLDALPAAEIVAFSQGLYGNKWQKRFEEDLVELLTQMGHPPRDKVTLVVRSLASLEKRTLEDVPMTSANRRAIRDAAQARERHEQQ